MPPGAMVPGFNATLLNESLESEIFILDNVTLPVLVAVKVYVIISPAFKPDEELAVLTNAIFGFCVSGTTVGLLSRLLLLSDTSVILALDGSFAFTVAVFVILPASISAWVIV